MIFLILYPRCMKYQYVNRDPNGYLGQIKFSRCPGHILVNTSASQCICIVGDAFPTPVCYGFIRSDREHSCIDLATNFFISLPAAKAFLDVGAHCTPLFNLPEEKRGDKSPELIDNRFEIVFL